MKKSLMTGAVVALAAGAAAAHEGDYGLLIQGGQVVTGLGNPGTGEVTDVGERVYGADLEDNGTYWAAEEPGLFMPGGQLPDGTTVGFTIEAALRYWDGSGAVNFSTIPSELMTLGFGPSTVDTPAADADVAGFTFSYDEVAGVHEHFDFLIDNSAAGGVYLLQMRFQADGYADSWSTWTVFNAGLDEEYHEEAIEWVEATYVPAPGGVGLLALAGLASRRRRR